MLRNFDDKINAHNAYKIYVKDKIIVNYLFITSEVIYNYYIKLLCYFLNFTMD